MVRYWPEKGKSGFLVWRYFLRRDDPIPPVWTTEGKKRAEDLGLDQVIVRRQTLTPYFKAGLITFDSFQYPEGHLEAMEAKEQEKKTAGSKRKSVVEMMQKDPESQAAKKAKKAGYQLESDIAKLIGGDTVNKKLWDECKNSLGDTKQVR